MVQCNVQVGAWGPCPVPCGIGVRNRTVVCVDALGEAMPRDHCPARPPADELACNVLPCNFCTHTNCAGQARGDLPSLPELLCAWCMRIHICRINDFGPVLDIMDAQASTMCSPFTIDVQLIKLWTYLVS